jgi:hypothetical protein
MRGVVMPEAPRMTGALKSVVAEELALSVSIFVHLL